MAESFSWPFRGDWHARWVFGVLCVLLLPVLFMPLFGYAIDSLRTAALDPSSPPPRWRWSMGAWLEGAWTAFAIALSTLPFVLAYYPLVNALAAAGLYVVFPSIASIAVLAFLWGLVALVVAPHTTAAYALSGRPGDLFDVGGALRTVRTRFTAWNLAVAAIVTGWAIGLACIGLLCAGVVPGVFYAILVSAHAAATLQRESRSLSAR